jgi:hypothetical protein
LQGIFCVYMGNTRPCVYSTKLTRLVSEYLSDCCERSWQPTFVMRRYESRPPNQSLIKLRRTLIIRCPSLSCCQQVNAQGDQTPADRNCHRIGIEEKRNSPHLIGQLMPHGTLAYIYVKIISYDAAAAAAHATLLMRCMSRRSGCGHCFVKQTSTHVEYKQISRVG